MKKLLKIASLLMILISSFTFAQYNPDGCIPIPDPLKNLIKNPIRKDMLGNPDATLRAKELGENLMNFKENLYKYSSGGTVPKDLIDIIEHSSETAYYEIPRQMAEKSSSVDDLRTNIRAALKSETNTEMIEFYIGWEYQLQILQNSGLQFESRVDWRCLSAIAGGVLVGATAGGAVGTAIPGVGTGAGAVIGGLIGGTIAGVKNCK